MSLLLAVAVLLAVSLLFTLFVRVSDVPAPEPVSPTQHLDERKAAIYENLRDLQFEYRVGKLSDADYQATKLNLQKELAGVLAEIDKLGGKPAPKPLPLNVCPSCGARFPKPMKFCGECG